MFRVYYRVDKRYVQITPEPQTAGGVKTWVIPADEAVPVSGKRSKIWIIPQVSPSSSLQAITC